MYKYLCIHYIFWSIQSSMDIFSCILDIVGNAEMNMRIQKSLWVSDLISFRNGLLNQMALPFFIFYFLKCLFILRGEGQIEGERIQSNFHMSAQSMLQGSVSQTVRSWSEPKSRVGRITNWAIQAPPIFNFLRNLHITFHSGCTSLYSHQQCTSVPFSTSLQYMLFTVFLIIDILTAVILFYCDFGLHFSNDQWFWVSFHEGFGHLYVTVWEMSAQVICPI